jgi:LuxR family maltose regulon positive regulatory protein
MPQVAAAPALLASKLHRPRLTKQHISRPRLIDRLDRYSDRPLMLICAPAGSGKSTLLSEWIDTTSDACAWVSLDERDNDLFTFVSYVVAAVQAALPSAIFETRNVLRAPTLPSLDTLSTSLSNDLDRIDGEFRLVLDDFHLISNPEIHELLLQLLRHPPRDLHLIVATRTEPSWPLTTLRTRGQVTELHFADLEFTPHESAAYLKKALGDEVAAKCEVTLYEESDGWIAALQLMAIAIGQQGQPQPARHDASGNEDTTSYLFREVLSQLPPLVRERLQQLSILDRFNAPLCEAVCDEAGSIEGYRPWGKDFLTEIEQRNLFVIALDLRHGYFRFHQLFQRFLAETLSERATPDQIAELHRRASAWFAAHGLIEEALDHSLTAGDVMVAADLVARHRYDLYNREQFGRLTRWLRRLPLDTRRDNPELLLAEARIATLNWQFTEATVLLERAHDALMRSTLDQARAEVAAAELTVLRGTLDLANGNAGRLLRELPSALARLPVDASHLRGLAHMGIATAHWQQGDAEAAQRYLDSQLATASPQLPIYSGLLQAQGWLHWLNGNITSLLATARRLLSVSQELDLPDQMAFAHLYLGVGHLARAELDVAREHLEATMTARWSMRLLSWCHAVGTLAKIYQALGRPDDAVRTLNEGRDFLLARHAVRVLPNLGAFQAEIDRRQDRFAEASAWAVQVEPGPLDWSLGTIEPRLVQARIFVAQGDIGSLDRATALLAEMRAFCEKVPYQRLVMQLDALAAMIAYRKGERAAAIEIVERLVLSAEHDGWIRLFVAAGEPMEDLLRELVSRQVASHTIARILKAFPPRSSTSASSNQNGTIEPLSERELEILELLTARDSNKEIAAMLFIAPSTVKRHTLNIYRKLEVNNRREAVSRATELGLISA